MKSDGRGGRHGGALVDVVILLKSSSLIDIGNDELTKVWVDYVGGSEVFAEREKGTVCGRKVWRGHDSTVPVRDPDGRTDGLYQHKTDTSGRLSQMPYFQGLITPNKLDSH